MIEDFFFIRGAFERILRIVLSSKQLRQLFRTIGCRLSVLIANEKYKYLLNPTVAGVLPGASNPSYDRRLYRKRIKEVFVAGVTEE